MCIVGSQTFGPISWTGKKQTVVSHSSSEAEVTSLDTGLRMEGLLAWTLLDIVIGVLEPLSIQQGETLRVNSNSFCDKDDNQWQEPARASCFTDASLDWVVERVSVN